MPPSPWYHTPLRAELPPHRPLSPEEGWEGQEFLLVFLYVAAELHCWVCVTATALTEHVLCAL